MTLRFVCVAAAAFAIAATPSLSAQTAPGAARPAAATALTSVVPGSGRTPDEGDQVTVDYIASLADGTVIDRGDNAVLVVGRMIPGFDAALRQMQVGGRYRFTVPAALAYGDAGRDPIPPGSDLAFDVTVHAIASPGEAAAALVAAHPIGLETIVAGVGERPTDADVAVISYTGRLTNGTQFDTGTSVSLPVDGVVPGFAEGLKRMQPGGRYRLTIPAILAYGAQGAGPVPPNSDLIFDVTLHSVQTPQTAAAPR